MRKEIILIAAVDEDWGIAKNGRIPWHKAEDLRFFRQQTMGHVLISGRKTFETLKGSKLTGRHLGVCSKRAVGAALSLNAFRGFSQTFPVKAEIDTQGGCRLKSDSVFYDSELDRLLAWAKSSREDVYIIGGAQIYEACLGICDRVILSHIDGRWGCDLFFPSLRQKFELSLTRKHHSFVERQYLRIG